MRPQDGILFRRTLATAFDTFIEVTGGFLGSYFGMMLAALLESLKEGPAEQMQHSMWSGFGFGLVFWTLSISFLNRVLIQGLSRASLGKKIFKLELISVSKPLTWTTILERWVMGFGSFGLAGAGYISAFFDKEGRTFHDVVCHTDVVPSYVSSSMSVEYRDLEPIPMHTLIANLREKQAQELTKIPVAVPATHEVPATPAATLADVIELRPSEASKTGTDDSGSSSEAA